MAKFVGGMDQDLLKMFETLEKDTDKMLSDMVSTGAEVVKTNCEAKMPRELKKAIDSQIKVSKVYKTPSDDGINKQVMYVCKSLLCNRRNGLSSVFALHNDIAGCSTYTGKLIFGPIVNELIPQSALRLFLERAYGPRRRLDLFVMADSPYLDLVHAGIKVFKGYVI